MIPEHVVANILDTAQVEDVIQDFIPLKKRGANYIANCPFHNEKTPSFSVSPAKGIYKCFGCGKAGNAARFVMDHEQMTYPEALRYLAKKYNIELEEVNNEELVAEKKERDSLFIVTKFAGKYFTDNLLHTDEGKSVGLSYFHKRGFSQKTIETFQLGYSMESAKHFMNTVSQKGYKLELLKKVGLVSHKNNRHFPFFRARVMFTIHNLSGKIIAFAGRTLKSDKKIPKYINSPETEIYNKSKILYGIFQAKKAIRQEDNCYLVEGYTDVISLFQAGVENVVASSGTALTKDQVRLIKRFTTNITILYDGDAAGVKAALRGIDLVLEQGMNVKVVLLPPDEDPDSFIQKNGKAKFDEYVEQQAKDFIFFKTDLLLKEAGKDPIRKANLVNEIIKTLSKIPDPIKRSLYVRECSSLLEVSEQLIVNETNRIKWQNLKKYSDAKDRVDKKSAKEEAAAIEQALQLAEVDEKIARNLHRQKEKVFEQEIIRLMLEYGKEEITVPVVNEQTNEVEVVCESVIDYILNEVGEIPFEKPNLKQLMQLFQQYADEGQYLNSDYFISHTDEQISATAIALITSPYQLSHNWEIMHSIFITPQSMNFQEEVIRLVDHYKLNHVMKMLDELAEKMKNHKNNEQQTAELLKKHMILTQWKQELTKRLNIIIIR